MGTRPRVLVIDDSAITLDVTRAALELSGFETRTAASLGEFNVILKSWLPDIVLTDVNMPGVSGTELCQWLKARMESKRVHVILFSGLPKEDLRKLAREAGADAYISKETADFGGTLRTFCEMVL